MSNPFIDSVSRTVQNTPLPGMLNNVAQIAQVVNQFFEFKNSFQGDPQKKVQELLDSGEMTPNQFNQLQQIAKMVMPIIQKFQNQMMPK